VRRKPLVAGLVVVAAAAAALGFFWPFGGRPDTMRLPGIVEIQEIRLASKIGGRVARVEVREGDVVSPGKPLVYFDEPELEAQRQQVKAKLDAATADLAKLEKGLPDELKAAAAAADAARARWERAEHGWREEEKEQARNDLAAAEADLRQALEDYERLVKLLRQRVASREQFDAALAARDRARGRAESARARFSMLMAGTRKEDKAEAKAEWQRLQAQWRLLRDTRPEDVKSARAKVEELRGKLREIDANLEERVVKSPPTDRVVIEVLGVRAGDVVAPNQPIIRALRAEDLWVRCYVPETDLGKVRLRQPAEVTIDAEPGKRFRGRVIQINTISEFTPRNVQSVDERRHQVFGVKVQIDDPQGQFHAGMAAEVLLPLEP
jgi:multidrug resistance efflux pump